MTNNSHRGHRGARTSCWLEQRSDLQPTPPPVNPSINLHVGTPAGRAEGKKTPPTTTTTVASPDLPSYLYFLLSFSAWIHPAPRKLPSYFTNALGGGGIPLSRKSVITQELHFFFLSLSFFVPFTLFHAHRVEAGLEILKTPGRVCSDLFTKSSTFPLL